MVGRWASNSLAGVLMFLMAGCWGIPIPTDSPFGAAPLGSLEGENKEVIIEKFGQPAHELKNKSKSYFVYRGIGEYWHIVFLAYLPLGAYPSEADMLYCAFMEFDESDTLRRYEIKTKSETYSSNLHNIDCRSLFWSESELAALEDVTSSSSKKRKPLTRTCQIPFSEAEQLSDEDLTQSYIECSRRDSSNRRNILLWSCLAAHRGNPAAQNYMGRHFEDEHQETGITNALLESYKWYSLALDSGIGSSHHRARVASRMTPSQLSEAKQMWIDWQPNTAECEATSRVASGLTKPDCFPHLAIRRPIQPARPTSASA